MTQYTSNSFSISVNEPPSGVPSWAQISSNNVVAINPSGPHFQTIDSVTSALGTFPEDIFAVWCGGGLRRIGGVPYLIVHGGGHARSAVNGIYAFGPLTDETPVWSVVEPRSSNGTVVLCQTSPYSDGKVPSTHTRDNIVVTDNEIVLLGLIDCYCATGAQNNRNIFKYSYSSGNWSDTGAGIGPGTHSNLLLPSGYNPNDGLIWYKNTGGSEPLSAMNPSTGNVATYGSSYAMNGECQGGIDPLNNNFYVNDQDLVRQYLFDLSNPSSLPVRVTGNQGQPLTRSKPQWDTVKETFRVLSSDADAVYEMGDPTNLNSWATIGLSGDIPTAFESGYGGHNGRWPYVEELGGNVFVGHHNAPVYFYKS